MDNREVLVKLQYTTKYGIELHSSRVLRNFPLYKHLALKHVSEQVYIDYSNEDCEIVNLKELLNNSVIITNKTQIESYNNLKDSMYKNINNQYDLFTLIDNAYNDVFNYYVENDLAFEKYTYFYKKLLLLSKNLMNNYTQYIGTEKFPKDMNNLFEMEIGEQKFNQLVEWMLEPILNDSNINCLINNLLNQIGIKQLSVQSQNDNVSPCHKNATQRFNETLNKPVLDMKEKVIITKNQQGYYTFKDLIFNLKTSLVIGKWNSQTMSMDKLSNDDINTCKMFNLKYDEQRIETTQNIVQTVNLENKNTIQDIMNILQKHETEKIEKTDNQVELGLPPCETQIDSEKINEVLNENKDEVSPLLSESDNVNNDISKSQESTSDSSENQNNKDDKVSQNEDLSSINPNVVSFVPLSVNDKVSKTQNRKKITMISSTKRR